MTRRRLTRREGENSRAGASLVKMLVWSAIVDLARERTGIGVNVWARGTRSSGCDARARAGNDEARATARPLLLPARRAAIADDIPVCGGRESVSFNGRNEAR